jgi:hypothetical protein
VDIVHEYLKTKKPTHHKVPSTSNTIPFNGGASDVFAESSGANFRGRRCLQAAADMMRCAEDKPRLYMKRGKCEMGSEMRLKPDLGKVPRVEFPKWSRGRSIGKERTAYIAQVVPSSFTHRFVYIRSFHSEITKCMTKDFSMLLFSTSLPSPLSSPPWTKAPYQLHRGFSPYPS